MEQPPRRTADFITVFPDIRKKNSKIIYSVSDSVDFCLTGTKPPALFKEVQRDVNGAPFGVSCSPHWPWMIILMRMVGARALHGPGGPGPGLYNF